MNAITAAGWAMAAGYMAQQSLLATGEPAKSASLPMSAVEKVAIQIGSGGVVNQAC